MPAHIVAFILSAIFLSKSATFLVKELTALSKILGLTRFTVSFILMAVATSLPEAVVGVTSALDNKAALSLGNVLGSNIADLTLVIGLGALFCRGIKVQERVAQKDIFYMNLSATIPLIMLWDGILSRAEGVILLLIFFYYMYRLVIEQKDYSEKFNHVNTQTQTKISHITRFVVGVIVMVASAEVMVRSASSLAVDLRIPLVMIGLFAVAVGTSLPELSFQITTMVKRKSSMAFGNILGSVVTNSTLVLGLTSVIKPITVSHTSLFVLSSFFLIGVLAIFTIFLRSEKKLSWNEGVGLTLIYIIFMITEFTLGGI